MLIGRGIVFTLVPGSIRHISVISAPCYSWCWVSNDNSFKESKFPCEKRKEKDRSLPGDSEEIQIYTVTFSMDIKLKWVNSTC